MIEVINLSNSFDVEELRADLEAMGISLEMVQDSPCG